MLETHQIGKNVDCPSALTFTLSQIQLPSHQLNAGESFREQGDSSESSGKQTSPHTQTSFTGLFYYLKFLSTFIKLTMRNEPEGITDFNAFRKQAIVNLP